MLAVFTCEPIIPADGFVTTGNVEVVGNFFTFRPSRRASDATEIFNWQLTPISGLRTDSFAVYIFIANNSITTGTLSDSTARSFGNTSPLGGPTTFCRTEQLRELRIACHSGQIDCPPTWWSILNPYENLFDYYAPKDLNPPNPFHLICSTP